MQNLKKGDVIRNQTTEETIVVSKADHDAELDVDGVAHVVLGQNRLTNARAYLAFGRQAHIQLDWREWTVIERS